MNGFDFSGSDLRNTGVERAKGDSKTVFSGAIFDGPSLDPAVINFNRQLKEMRFSEVWNNFEKALNREPRCFDVISFTTVLAKASSRQQSEQWIQRMIEFGVKPNEFTFGTPMNKAVTEAEAARWHEEMLKTGVAPNVTKA